MSAARSRRRLAEAALAALLLPAHAFAAEATYLHHIPTAGDVRIPADATPLRVMLHVREDAVFRHLGKTKRREARGTLTFELGGHYEPLPGEPSASHRAATFMVDFDERPVVDLAASLKLTAGQPLPIPDLTRTVSSALQSTMAWGWQLASEVAKRRNGDCTEHAVLLTALARYSGRPARVVLGVLLADGGQHTAAFGHAWAEIHDGQAWVLADATLRDTDVPIRVRHVPLAAVENEGPGYGNELFGLMSRRWPTRIDLAAPAAPKRK
jgi:hypothetical protein